MPRFFATAALAALALGASMAYAEIKTETVEYKHGDTTLKGFLAYDDAVKDKRPGVIVIHEWWGLNDYVKDRAKQVAELGYVAFAPDMFGEGRTTNDPKEAGKWAGEIYGDAEKRRARTQAAIDQLKARPEVNGGQIAAIGYCFGGSVALDMARAGQDVDGVVSFHGALKTDTPAKKDQNVQAKVLVLHGDADPLVPNEEVEAFEKEMKDAGIAYNVVRYPGAKHGFTNPEADKRGMPPLAYQKEADEQSWQAMKEFLARTFGQTTATPSGTKADVKAPQ